MAIAPSPIVGPVEDFEARTWREALRNFQMNSGHKEMMDDFLRKTTTPSIVAQTCREKQRDASSQYGKILGKILGKIDIFIRYVRVMLLYLLSLFLFSFPLNYKLLLILTIVLAISPSREHLSR